MAEEQRAPGLEGRAGAEGRALAAAVLEATERLLAATDREGVKKPSRPAWVPNIRLRAAHPGPALGAARGGSIGGGALTRFAPRTDLSR